MNRRRFIQRCLVVLGGTTAVFMPSKAKSEIIFAPRQPEEKQRNIAYCTFRGYRFIGIGNGIIWKEIGPPATLGTWTPSVWVKLPTLDRIRYFHVYKNQLFWVGEHETWEIQYCEEESLKFQLISPHSEIHTINQQEKQ